MRQSLARLIADNNLQRLDELRFKGCSSDDSADRIYGGQVMAQALSAGQQTVAEALVVHSMHGYFLRQGDPAQPVVYHVEPVRDGRSYCTRTVRALQNDQLIFTSTQSFQKTEQGLSHQSSMPKVLSPEQLISDREIYKAFLGDSDYGWPLEFVQVEPVDFNAPLASSPHTYTWFKAASGLVDDPLLHQQLLIYASDNPILTTALRPHGISHFSPGVMVSSLDHALWFHQPCRVDQWLLFEAESDFSGGGRAMSRGKIYDQLGRLVASVAQEGVLRYRP